MEIDIWDIFNHAKSLEIKLDRTLLAASLRRFFSLCWITLDIILVVEANNFTCLDAYEQESRTRFGINTYFEVRYICVKRFSSYFFINILRFVD